MAVSDDDLLDDLNRVAKKLGKAPTVREYISHGNYTNGTIRRRFDGWNNALIAIGCSRNTGHGLTNEELLKHAREGLVNGEIGSIERFIRNNLDYSHKTYFRRFGGHWSTIVRAGQRPPTGIPISEADYDSYIQTAINAEYPSVSFLGLLRAFTGLPGNVLNNFSSDWVSRLDSDLQPTLITVPSEYIHSDDNWVLKVPTHYTVAGERKPTSLEPLLRWLNDTDGRLLKTERAKYGILSNLISEAGLDTEPLALRATVATHLARRGVSKFEIEMQVGFEKTGWDRSVEDYFLYLYQFEDYCHPDYEPSGVFLDPDSGEPRQIDSDAN